MKTNETSANNGLSLRQDLRQGIRQRQILTGISVLLVITASILYYLIQQEDVKAAKPVMPAVKEKVVTSHIILVADAAVADNVPVIKWEGEFPQGSDFTIERIESEGGWVLVQRVPMEEVMIDAHTYRFTDYEAGGGEICYRISCLDDNNKVISSDEVRLTLSAEVRQSLTITGISPMQFKDAFTVELEATREDVLTFEVLDYNGNPVYNEVYKANKGLNLVAFTRGAILPNGVYIVRITGAGDASAMTKIVKQ